MSLYLVGLKKSNPAAPQQNAERNFEYCGTLESVIRHAREFHDGHFFVLSFTTGYKGGFGTPDLDSGAGRDEVLLLDGFKTLDALLDHMLSPCCGCIRLTGGHI